MRCYHYNNFYLSGIHAGIQSAHAQTELALKYIGTGNEGSWYYKEWAVEHKTMVVLNGGQQSSLLEMEEFLSNSTNPYPWAAFRESEEALNGALTNIALVLPERMYQDSRLIHGVLSKCTWEDGEVYSAVAGHDVTYNFIVCGDKVIVNWFANDGIASGAWEYTKFDIELMGRSNRCGLM